MFARFVIALTLLCSTAAFATPLSSPRAMERAARKAAFARFLREVPRDEFPNPAAEFRKNARLYAKASVAKPHMVNLALRTKEDGKWLDMALVTTWNSRTNRLSQLRIASPAKPSVFANAAAFDRLVKIAPSLAAQF